MLNILKFVFLNYIYYIYFRRAASAETTENTHFAILEKEKFKEILSGIDSGVAFIAHYANMNFFNGWDYNKIKMIYDISTEYEYGIHNTVYKEVKKNTHFLLKKLKYQRRGLEYLKIWVNFGGRGR